jgi:hypothetical protein
MTPGFLGNHSYNEIEDSPVNPPAEMLARQNIVRMREENPMNPLHSNKNILAY